MVRAWGKKHEAPGLGQCMASKEGSPLGSHTEGVGTQQVKELAPKPVQQDGGDRTRLDVALIPWLRELARPLLLWPFASVLSLTLGFSLLSAPQCPPASSEKS